MKQLCDLNKINFKKSDLACAKAGCMQLQRTRAKKTHVLEDWLATLARLNVF